MLITKENINTSHFFETPSDGRTRTGGHYYAAGPEIVPCHYIATESVKCTTLTDKETNL